MGLFDYVNVKLNCPSCGHLNTEWQTKDGPRLMILIEPREVYNLYAICRNCKERVEYSRKAPEVPLGGTIEPVKTLKDIEALGFTQTIGVTYDGKYTGL